MGGAPRTIRTGLVSLAIAASLGGCSPDAPQQPPLTAPERAPAAEPAPSEQAAADDDEDAVPPHQYRGVAGFRAPQGGACPDSYALSHGLCVHERLTDARSPHELAVAMKAFMDGAMPPIVADAPKAAARDPGAMEPGALRASEEELRKRAQGRSTAGAGPPRAGSPADDPEPMQPGQPGLTGQPGQPAVAQLDDQRAAVLQTGVRLLGAGLAGGSSPGGGSTGGELDDARRMLGQLQTITGDGQVDIGEAGQLFQMLGNQLEGMELPPEMRTPNGPRGLDGR